MAAASGTIGLIYIRCWLTAARGTFPVEPIHRGKESSHSRRQGRRQGPIRHARHRAHRNEIVSDFRFLEGDRDLPPVRSRPCVTLKSPLILAKDSRAIELDRPKGPGAPDRRNRCHTEDCSTFHPEGASERDLNRDLILRPPHLSEQSINRSSERLSTSGPLYARFSQN